MTLDEASLHLQVLSEVRRILISWYTVTRWHLRERPPYCVTFNHLRCRSSSTALGTRTGYWKPTLRGTDETPQSLNEDQPFFTSVLTLLYNIYSIRTAKKLHLENWIWKFSNAVSCTSYIKYMVNRESEAMAHHNKDIYSKQIFVWYNLVSFKLPYTRHHNPLLIWNRSWL